MCHLVRLDAEDRLPLALARDHRIVEQDAFESEDRAPILHRTEELRLAGTGDIIELRQRVGGTEILVVIGQDLGLGVERELPLRPISA